MNPASDEATPDIMRATRRGKCLSALFVALTLGALLGFQFYALPLLIALLADQSTNPPSLAAVRLAQCLFFGVGAVGLLTAALLIHNARKILRSGQTPPDNLWLWRDTPVMRGPRARRIAWISIVAGILTALLCSALAAYILLTLNEIAPYALRPGVTVVHQKSWLQ